VTLQFSGYFFEMFSILEVTKVIYVTITQYFTLLCFVLQSAVH